MKESNIILLRDIVNGVMKIRNKQKYDWIS